MSKIKLNMRRLSVPEKIARAQQIVAALTGNPHFTAPHPTLAEVTAAIDELETAANAAQAARHEARMRTATQSSKEEALIQVLTQLVAHVESIAGDDEEMILSAGLEMRASNASQGGLPAAPDTLTAEMGYQEGQVELAWKSVRGARSYVVEHCLDGQADAGWTHAGVTPRPAMYVEGLTSGTRYRFRVAAVSLNGQSPWSNHIVRTAP